MRWLHAGVVILAALPVIGCPSEFGKDGRIGKAASKDTADLTIKRCSQAKIEEVCGNGKQDTPECRDCLN
jgi:hypothetical protein